MDELKKTSTWVFIVFVIAVVVVFVILYKQIVDIDRENSDDIKKISEILTSFQGEVNTIKSTVSKLDNSVTDLANTTGDQLIEMTDTFDYQVRNIESRQGQLISKLVSDGVLNETFYANQPMETRGHMSYDSYMNPPAPAQNRFTRGLNRTPENNRRFNEVNEPKASDSRQYQIGSRRRRTHQ